MCLASLSCKLNDPEFREVTFFYFSLGYFRVGPKAFRWMNL